MTKCNHTVNSRSNTVGSLNTIYVDSDVHRFSIKTDLIPETHQNESEIDFGLLTISKIDQKFSYKGSARSLVFPHGNEAVLSAIRRRFSFSELNGSLTSPQMKW